MKRTDLIGKVFLCAWVTAWAWMATAAEPWAMWTNFTGANAETGLAPQVSSTQNDIDGGAWRFKLAGEASVDGGGGGLSLPAPPPLPTLTSGGIST